MRAAGTIHSLYRSPVKGFTPERLDAATLTAGDYFPCDRIYAVENGPSGFDPAAPAHISKGRFTVLARIAEVAKARTRYDDATGVLTAEAPGLPTFAGDLSSENGRTAFASWLTMHLEDAASGPLRVLAAPSGHRFMDHPQGYVSIVNLESVRDLEQRVGKPIDPLRFRANLYVDGWPAWVEIDAVDSAVRIGEARGEVFQPITRCVATHVNPATGDRDIEVVEALFNHYGHRLCGIYVKVTGGGRIAPGEPGEIAA